LLGAAPRVVTKRELHARLWPGGTVTDATLVALVKQLRRALDDQERQAPLIRTVHRVGYALDLPIAAGQGAEPMRHECWLMAGSRRLPLVAGENLIGRDAEAHVRLDDAGVSRIHARIEVRAVGARIVDLGSKNGTFCDGWRLAAEPITLRDGCRLRFGPLQVIYRESGGDGATLTHVALE
jgi:hypothetical protein